MLNKEDTISIIINDEELSGFESIQVQTSLETICGTFVAVLTEKQGGSALKFKAQSPCIVKVGNIPVITGYIETVLMKISNDSHIIEIHGRDKTADIIDSSVVIPPLQYKRKSNLMDLVLGWVKPHKIAVIKDYENPAFLSQTFVVSAGETVAECIIRACKSFGILPTTDGNGALRLSSSGGRLAEDSLVWGVNVKSGDVKYDYSNRFYSYTFRTQNPNSDSENVVNALWNRTINSFGSVTDSEVVRKNRSIIMTMDQAASSEECKKRAEVEALVRAVASQEASVTLQGWRQFNKKLWEKNYIVRCDLEPLHINQEMLISEVVYSISEEGSEVTLKLVRPDAFNPGVKLRVPRRSAVASVSGKNSVIKKQTGIQAALYGDE